MEISSHKLGPGVVWNSSRELPLLSSPPLLLPTSAHSFIGSARSRHHCSLVLAGLQGAGRGWAREDYISSLVLCFDSRRVEQTGALQRSEIHMKDHDVADTSSLMP